MNFQSPPIVSTDPVHVVLTVADLSQKFYINGYHNPHYENFDGFRIDSFTTTYLMDFFTSEFFNNRPAYLTEGTLAPWAGDLYMFSMYNRVLTDAEVGANFKASFTNSPPTVASKSFSVMEDAEPSPGGLHYSDPIWYRSQTPVADITPIDLSSVAYDADNDFPSFPGYDAATAITSKLFVKTLPAQGELFVAETNVKITAADTLLPSGKIKYRPKKDASGASFDSFNVYAVDGRDATSKSATDATITVSVTAVNDPPVNKASSTASILVGVESTMILALNGTDVDDSNPTVAYITKFPSSGDLYDVESDGVTRKSTKLSSASLPVKLSGSKVGYVYTSTSYSPNPTGLLGADEFSFAVADSHDVQAVPGKMSLKVYSSFSAVASTALADISAKEEIASPIKLKGADQATTKRALKYQIAKLPGHGYLLDPDDATKTRLAVGSIISKEDVPPYTGVAVTYVSDKDYFNYPAKKNNGTALDADYDSFDFNVVLSGAPGAKSLSVTQEVRVQNVNDLTALVMDSVLPLSVYSFTSTAMTFEEDCKGKFKDNGACKIPQVLKIYNIHATDVDHGVDRVVVKIDTTHSVSMLSLNRAALKYADFNTCKTADPIAGRDWTCRGDGDSDSEMTFLAQPGDLNLLFQGLKYEFIGTGPTTENVTITIYDGADGLCLPEASHSTTSIRGDCKHVKISFAVDIVEYKTPASGSNVKGWLPFGITLPFTVMLGIGGAIIIVSCGCCVFIRHKCKKASKRRSTAADRKKSKSSGENTGDVEVEDVEVEDVEVGDVSVFDNPIADCRSKSAKSASSFGSQASFGRSDSSGVTNENAGSTNTRNKAATLGRFDAYRKPASSFGSKASFGRSDSSGETNENSGSTSTRNTVATLGLKATSEGLKMAGQGLEKAQALHIGGPVTGVALKSVRFVKGKVDETVRPKAGFITKSKSLPVDHNDDDDDDDDIDVSSDAPKVRAQTMPGNINDVDDNDDRADNIAPPPMSEHPSQVGQQKATGGHIEMVQEVGKTTPEVEMRDVKAPAPVDGKLLDFRPGMRAMSGNNDIDNSAAIPGRTDGRGAHDGVSDETTRAKPKDKVDETVRPKAGFITKSKSLPVDHNDYDADDDPKPPHPPPRSKSTWFRWRDSASGEFFFEDERTGRTTFTNPSEGFKKDDSAA